jgi:hypothetical protein
VAIGTWEDFTEKYGFGDGETVEGRDFRARKRLVAMLNKLPAMKGLRAVEYDRPGLHNPCLIVVLPNPEGRTDQQLNADWEAGKIGTCGLPEAVEDKIHGLVDKAYAKARRR